MDNEILVLSEASFSVTSAPLMMWDQRYSEPGFAYGTKPNNFLVDASTRLHPASRILCLAEGEGRNAVYLAGQGHHVIAVDSSAVGLQKARSLAAGRRVSIDTVVADLNDFVIDPGAYGAIISIFCHLPPALRKTVHRNVCSGLATGGYFILEGFAQKQMDNDTGGPRHPELLLDLEELKRELAPLDCIHAVETEREVREGSYHCGLGAVVQIIAIKTDSEG
jgi:hypothetical protein